MGRTRVATALATGLLLAGCGAPVILPATGARPLPLNATAGPLKAGVGLAADKVWMPPLEVFKSFETDSKRFVSGLKKDNDVQWAVLSPVLHTLRLKVGYSKVGYLVTANGNLKWNPSTNEGRPAALLATFAYAPDGKALGYGSTFMAVGDNGKYERQPGRLATDPSGPLALKFLEQAPDEVARLLTGLHPEQSRKVAAMLPRHKVSPLSNIPWVVEIAYEGQVVGYLDEQYTAAIGEPSGFLGVKVLNLVDAGGMEVAAQGWVVNSKSPLGYKEFKL